MKRYYNSSDTSMTSSFSSRLTISNQRDEIKSKDEWGRRKGSDYDEKNGLHMGDELVKTFCVTKLFQLNKGKVNHIDFDRSGELAITSSTDDQIILYNCQSGTHQKSCFSKKYGVDLVTFTHSPKTVIYASSKVGHELRYLSLHDNKFIRYFPGHTDKVICLKKSPVDDSFITSSKDKTVRLWDLRSPNCQGLLHLLRPAVAAFDPEGLLFAIGLDNDTIKLYDIRSFDKGPFNTFRTPAEPVQFEWTDIRFSPCGSNIMINTDGPRVRVVDAFHGKLKYDLGNRQFSSVHERLDATYSPDSKYIFAASSDGKVHTWRTSDGVHVAILNSLQPSALRCLKFNPKFMVMVSADSETAFWLPRTPDGLYFEEIGSLNTKKNFQNR